MDVKKELKTLAKGAAIGAGAIISWELTDIIVDSLVERPEVVNEVTNYGGEIGNYLLKGAIFWVPVVTGYILGKKLKITN